jgi:hypothetical protein
LAHEGTEKIAGAIQNKLGPPKTLSSKAGSHDPSVRRPARVKPFRPTTVTDESIEATRHAASQPDGRSDLIAIEFHDPASRDGRRHRPYNARRMKALRTESSSKNCAKPCRNFVASDNRSAEIFASCIARLSQSKRSRHNHAAWMNHGVRERVVEIPAMRQGSVAQCFSGWAIRFRSSAWS